MILSAFRKVLIMDDHVDSAEVLGVYLAQRGHEVFTSNDGQNAMDIARKNLPNALILDIGMPNMGGFEVAKELRDELPDTVFVAYTGYIEVEKAALAWASGFDYFVAKPIETERMDALIRLPRPAEPILLSEYLSLRSDEILSKARNLIKRSVTVRRYIEVKE